MIKLCIFMVPVTKVPKLLGETELILKRLFSLVFLLYFRDSAFLARMAGRDSWSPLPSLPLLSPLWMLAPERRF